MRNLFDLWLTGTGHVFDFIDKRKVMRRIAFIWVLWITWEVIQWTMAFANASLRPGMEVTAIIAAVWMPMGALQAYIFRMYDQSRQSDKASPA